MVTYVTVFLHDENRFEDNIKAPDLALRYRKLLRVFGSSSPTMNANLSFNKRSHNVCRDTQNRTHAEHSMLRYARIKGNCNSYTVNDVRR